MITEKMKSLPELKEIVIGLKAEGKRIVFTNGCFDLLHLGHVTYLEQAKSKGDRLVVAVNSDESVRRIKGELRPITSQLERVTLVASLESVDYVIIFDELDPLKLIKTLKPDVLAKGGDWEPEQVVGSQVVKSYGGEVISIPYLQGYSTKSIIEKIIRRFSQSQRR